MSIRPIMFWLGLICLATVSGQPIACRSDDQCSEGSYCEGVAKICRECLRCEDLQRESPQHHSGKYCIKSVVECGGCLNGLVADHSTEFGQCVVPDQRDGSSWQLLVGIIIGLLMIVIIVGIAVYVWRNLDSFKILASTRASVQTPVVIQERGELPPPYNPFYNNGAPPDHPETYLPTLPSHGHYEGGDVTQPFIKRAPSAVPGEVKQSDGRQAAVAYNLPIYKHTDPRPESPIEAPEDSDRDNYNSNFNYHDENTVESPWTPNGGDSVNTNDGAVMAEPSGTSAEGGIVALPNTREAPAKQQAKQDTNNNRNRDNNSGAGEGGTGPVAAALVVNVSVQQHVAAVSCNNNKHQQQ